MKGAARTPILATHFSPENSGQSPYLDSGTGVESGCGTRGRCRCGRCGRCGRCVCVRARWRGKGGAEREGTGGGSGGEVGSWVCMVGLGARRW